MLKKQKEVLTVYECDLYIVWVLRVALECCRVQMEAEKKQEEQVHKEPKVSFMNACRGREL